MKSSMNASSFVPSLFLVIALGSAAAVCAQDSPSAGSCTCGQGGPGGPEHDPRIDAALKACRSKLGGTSKHLVTHELMDKCMEAKGFKHPAGPPPDFGDPLPPPPPPSWP